MTDPRPLLELNDYVREHTRAVRGESPPATPATANTPALIDVHFFKVLIGESFDKEHFRTLFDAFVAAGVGEFADVDLDRIKGGPSYIEWGGLIGDQGLAMQMMGAGAYAGLWDVIIPETLGVTGTEADRMAGAGFVMTSGLKALS